jgi:hypothetical protein
MDDVVISSTPHTPFKLMMMMMMMIQDSILAKSMVDVLMDRP